METSHWVRAVPVSMASKELSTTLSSAFRSLATSAAMSMSKPTILPSFWNSNGSYGTSEQTVSLPALMSCTPPRVEAAGVALRRRRR